MTAQPRNALNESSTAATPTASQGRVGRLTGEAWLEIHTDQAQRLIRGRVRKGNKPAITGLLGFASQMNTLWQAAADDDPYADWWLVRVEEAIAAAQAFLATQRVQVNGVALDNFRFRVGISHSRRPQTLMLQFATPHAYRAAQLLGEYDALVCQCLTLKHVGACPSGQMGDRIALGAHRLRGVFSLPQGFRVFAINRADVHHNTKRAQQARAHLGELPLDILSGERSAGHARSRVSPLAHAEPRSLTDTEDQLESTTAEQLEGTPPESMPVAPAAASGPR